MQEQFTSHSMLSKKSSTSFYLGAYSLERVK